MWGWFGGPNAQKRKEGPKNAILLLRQQLDMLQKRERHLESQITDQEGLAKKNLTANNRTGRSLSQLPSYNFRLKMDTSLVSKIGIY